MYLNKAGLVSSLHFMARGINSLNKPEKLFLDNTNMMLSLSGTRVDTGNARETFFLNQLNHVSIVNASKHADFLIDNKYTFEIGGPNKNRKQIKGIKNSFVVKDNIEIGYENVIPLWLFGFLY